MTALSLKNVSKSFGAVSVVKSVSLDVQPGEFIVFVGPSGCGKSTLLRMIAGLESITAGDLLIGGALSNEVEPSRRGIAMVFQSYALYPHMTVEENMGFALRYAGVPKAEINTRVAKAAANTEPHTPARQETQGPVWRPAPARGHWPGHRARSQDLPL